MAAFGTGPAHGAPLAVDPMLTVFYLVGGFRTVLEAVAAFDTAVGDE